MSCSHSLLNYHLSLSYYRIKTFSGQQGQQKKLKKDPAKINGLQIFYKKKALQKQGFIK